MQADCNLKCRSTQGRDYTHHFAPAADSHVFGQRNFGGHDQRQLDGISLGQRKIGTEECSPCAQILGDSLSFTLWNDRPDGHWKGKAKPLCCSSLEMTLDITHNSGTMRKSFSIMRDVSLASILSGPGGTVCQAGATSRQTLPQLLTRRKH